MSTWPDSRSAPHVDLNDGNRMPQLGFGVFRIQPDRTPRAVGYALATGYRLIDTAASYRNEAGVWQGLASSEVDRSDVFITTKLWNTDHGRDAARRAFERSLERLGGEYVDLYLIHWPVPERKRFVETWKALTELKADGRARSIGVANFEIEHLERIIDATGVVPAVNQIELHPHFQQSCLRQYHTQRGITTEAWSPLSHGIAVNDPTVIGLAAAFGRTPAQIVLRWHIQLGNIAIPKSVTRTRIEENLRISDFELTEDDMRTLAALDSARRIGPDPATFSKSGFVDRAAASLRKHYPAIEPFARRALRLARKSTRRLRREQHS